MKKKKIKKINFAGPAVLKLVIWKQSRLKSHKNLTDMRDIGGLNKEARRRLFHGLVVYTVEYKHAHMHVYTT